MQLFAHMGLWATALVLVLAFIAKYFAVEFILRLPQVAAQTANAGWAKTINITTGLHALLTFVILFVFTGYAGAVTYAILVGVVEYTLGYYRARHRIPQVTQEKLLQAYAIAGSLQHLSYVGVIATVMKYFISVKTGA